MKVKCQWCSREVETFKVKDFSYLKAHDFGFLFWKRRCPNSETLINNYGIGIPYQ